MPAVVSDPSLRGNIITQQGPTIFDYPDTPQPSILQFQTLPTAPLPDRTATATGLLAPDLLFARRLANFPEALFDLSPGSSLMLFLKALMGDAGAGQLRKRQVVAQLQSAVTSTNFYDLDAFYGALFGALRGPDGALPQNPSTGNLASPYTDLATQDAWDDIYSIDAIFRERIIQLARAITMGGTRPGLQAIAEAITGVPCQVYEVWALIDAQGLQGAPGSWAALQGQYPAWNAIPAGETWDELQSVVIYGGMGISARNEIIIVPRRTYDTTPAGQQQRAADEWGVLKVAEMLKPAASLVTVNTNGVQADRVVPITSMWADSEYWEVTTTVTPSEPASNPAYSVYLTSIQRNGKPVAADEALPTPYPPFSQSQGSQSSYVADVGNVQATSSTGPYDFVHALTRSNWETEHAPSGRTLSWKPQQALMTPAKAAAAVASSSVSMQSAPYSGPRMPVKSAT